jgi:phage protein D
LSVAILRPWPEVTIGGNPLSDAVEKLLEEVVVEHHLHQPDMFELRFRDLNRQVLSQAGLQIATEVKIAGYAPGSQSAETLIVGEVTAIEGEYTQHASHTIARGYDKSHRLHRGRRTETYQNVTDSDLARTVANRAGLDLGTIDSTSGTHEHVSQANLSDWEFLKARAREIGYEMAMVEGKFTFRKPVASSGAPGSGDYNSQNPLQLVLGQDLLEFYPRITSAEQVGSVTVNAWDPKQKQVVTGTAQAATSSSAVSATPSSLAGQFGSPSYALVDRPVATQAEVDAAAKAIAERIGSAATEAEGVCRGIPGLKAGTAVNIAEVPQDFAGKYIISNARHVFDNGGYRTHFTISGRHDRSLLGLVSMGAANGSASAGGTPIYGLVIGQVTDNNDPDQLGRVKVKFPWLAASYESFWARVAQLGAGPDSGAVFLPENNDEVLVAFEFGDVRRPYVIGSLWNGNDKPNLGSGLFDNGKLKRRGIVSRKGHKFVLFDDPSKSGIALISSDNNFKISLNETNTEIHIEAGSGGKVTIESQGDMTLKSQGKISVQSQQDLELSSQTGVTVQGQTQLQLKAAQVQMEGQATTTIKGGMVQIN